jgi:hypothetical protein
VAGRGERREKAGASHSLSRALAGETQQQVTFAACAESARTTRRQYNTGFGPVVAIVEAGSDVGRIASYQFRRARVSHTPASACHPIAVGRRFPSDPTLPGWRCMTRQRSKKLCRQSAVATFFSTTMLAALAAVPPASAHGVPPRRHSLGGSPPPRLTSRRPHTRFPSGT